MSLCRIVGLLFFFEKFYEKKNEREIERWQNYNFVDARHLCVISQIFVYTVEIEKTITNQRNSSIDSRFKNYSKICQKMVHQYFVLSFNFFRIGFHKCNLNTDLVNNHIVASFLRKQTVCVREKSAYQRTSDRDR